MDWMLCCASRQHLLRRHISTCCDSCAFIQRWPLTDPSLKPFFCRCLASLGLHRIEVIEHCSGFDFGLRGYYGRFAPLPRSPYSVSAAKLSCFLIIHIFTEVALLMPFKSLPFVVTVWLTGSRGCCLLAGVGF